MKAIALVSGGLDSNLALRLIKEQGIEIIAINFFSPFCLYNSRRNCKSNVEQIVEELGIRLKTINISQELLEIVKNPKHGYGSNLNPCIDCRIMIFQKAKKLIKEIGASFIITGEVVGQRPMSQYKHTLELIDKESGLQGLILRPLSAKILPATIPEEKGWVDRNKLLDFNGRSRKPQIELAKRFKLRDIPSSAGGCLLTDQGFSRRMKDLLVHCDADLNDIELLKLGRHFRLNKDTKLIVGRDQQENNLLIKLIKPRDIIFEPEKKNGPVALSRGDYEDSLIDLACKIVARYCNGDERPKINIEIKDKPSSENLSRQVLPLEEPALEKLRI